CLRRVNLRDSVSSTSSQSGCRISWLLSASEPANKVTRIAACSAMILRKDSVESAARSDSAKWRASGGSAEPRMALVQAEVTRQYVRARPRWAGLRSAFRDDPEGAGQ